MKEALLHIYARIRKVRGVSIYSGILLRGSSHSIVSAHPFFFSLDILLLVHSILLNPVSMTCQKYTKSYRFLTTSPVYRFCIISNAVRAELTIPSPNAL